eukprot:gb/GECG01016596.1/.p1 GENE.gb/GECG01016596.1/~~gb/GECG01016596.1/.p1  ORF type:complete len:148 (+),score=23.61 gb/GECG01016596.1/:1-444(+)
MKGNAVAEGEALPLKVGLLVDVCVCLGVDAIVPVKYWVGELLKALAEVVLEATAGVGTVESLAVLLVVRIQLEVAVIVDVWETELVGEELRVVEVVMIGVLVLLCVPVSLGVPVDVEELLEEVLVPVAAGVAVDVEMTLGVLVELLE